MTPGFRLLLALAILAVLVPSAQAEKPLSSPAVLREQATHVVLGRVARIYERTRHEGSYRKTGYVARIEVAAVEKGEDLPLDRPLYVRYWTQVWRGGGAPPPGTAGHGPLPEEGQPVRVHLARNAYDGFGTQTYDGGYDVLGINGFEFLTPEALTVAAERPPGAAPAFPEAWKGVWQGSLRIARADGSVEETTMSLAIQPTDRDEAWTFRLRYGEQPFRRYRLLVRDLAAGQLAIDEGNGIVLPATYVDGVLLSAFSVGGNLLTSSYRREGDILRFELTQVGKEPVVTSGGGEVPEVGGHAVRLLQRAALRR